MSEDSAELREHVANVAAAYFSNSHVSPTDIPNVIQQIAASLSAIGAPVAEEPAAEVADAAPELQKRSRAQIAKSITRDALISFEDSKPYKTLKRHLSVRGMSPEQYREKWGLPRDYPMVAPSYSEARSQVAKTLGLGRKRAAPATAAEPTAAPRRGRPRKTV